MCRLIAAAGLASVALTCSSFAQNSFDAGKADFSISVNGEQYPYREFATYVMPGERVALAAAGRGGAGYTLMAEGEQVSGDGPGRWLWTAPRQPGIQELVFRRLTDDKTVLLRVFVKVPASQIRDGALNGYFIGQYPPIADRPEIYAAPDGFIEVRRQDLWLPLSPHFVLGQFVSDQDDSYPKYVVLRERLLLKLEALLERVNERGHPARSFGIVNAYRTPAFNESIGGTPYSRHIYGGAAGIIVDRNPRDGILDDLDGDGRIGDGDAELLFRIADDLFREPEMDYLQGGLAVYRATPWRGPYLHVDARGYRARWDSDEDEQRLPQPIDPKHLRDFPAPGRAVSLF